MSPKQKKCPFPTFPFRMIGFKCNDRLSIVKGHRSTLANKEREILSREQALIEKEQHLASLLSNKEQEIASLHQLVGQLQQSLQLSQQEVEMTVKQAVIRREEELRVLICKREEEVALAMAQREEEIMEAVRNREEQLSDAWTKREAEMKKELEESLKSVDERIQWVVNKENDLVVEETRLNELREELEEGMRKIDEGAMKCSFCFSPKIVLYRPHAVRKEKNPLEEVKNRLDPLNRMTQGTPTRHLRRGSSSQPTPGQVSSTKIPSLETPVSRPAYIDFIPSAMKGIVLTSTGESLATPSQAELVTLFNCSPKVGLNFTKIFDFEGGDHDRKPARNPRDDEEEADSPPPSPSSRKTKEKERKKEIDESTESSSSASSSCALSTTTVSQVSTAAPPTRLRRPSIRNSTRPTHNRAGTLPTSASEPIFPTTIMSSSAQPKPLPHPHLRHSKSNSSLVSNHAPVIPATTMATGSHFQQRAAPEYDFTDEENLPSPFLKKNGKNSSQATAAGAVGPMTNLTAITPGTATSTSSSSTAPRGKRRPSNGLLLRAVAAANNAGRRGTISSTSTTVCPVLDNGDPQMESMPAVNVGLTTDNHDGGGIPRPSLASARKASEEARKTLLR